MLIDCPVKFGDEEIPEPKEWSEKSSVIEKGVMHIIIQDLYELVNGDILPGTTIEHLVHQGRMDPPVAVPV